MLPIHIEQITHELTWRLRQQVLYPDKAIRDMAMECDEDGIHYGAFTENKLVAVVSTFRQEGGVQMCKLAINPTLQHKGIGSRFLQYITERAMESSATLIWCNACIGTEGFYLKAGFKPGGNWFTENGIEHIRMDKEL